MKEVKTADGSLTFYNEQYKETYHSISGAEEEAFKKYAEPTKIQSLAKKGKINILDVCFGIGYNSAATIDIALETNPKCKINIVGLENDKKILQKINSINPGFENYNIIKDLIKNNYDYENKNIKIRIILGDARKTIKKVEEEFDIVFFDPFSPASHPEMWEEDFLKEIGEKTKKGGMLATYSCATHVRINLVRAGFEVKDGPIVGRRSPSTIAIKI